MRLAVVSASHAHFAPLAVPVDRPEHRRVSQLGGGTTSPDRPRRAAAPDRFGKLSGTWPRRLPGRFMRR